MPDNDGKNLVIQGFTVEQTHIPGNLNKYFFALSKRIC